jgi:hypothetical protein
LPLIRPLRLTLVLAALAGALAACAGGDGDSVLRDDRRSEAVNIAPANARSDLVAFLRIYLNDPSRIRDATISEPVLKQVGPVRRYVVCVRYNARDSTGKYTGAKDRLAIFVGGKLDQLLEQPRDLCGGVEQRPFSELERLTR